MSTTPAIIQLVQTMGATDLPTEEALKQLNPSEHKVMKPEFRKKRKKKIPTGEYQKDADGNYLKHNGEPVPVLKTEYEEVNRLAVPMQKIIVNRRAAFMNCGNMNILAKPEDELQERLLEMVKKCWRDNKLDYKLTDIAIRQMSELQVAMLWYSEKTDPDYWGDLAPKSSKRLRMKILSPTLGDKLLPVFNSSGELVYFAREYKSKIDATSQIDINNPTAELTTPLENTEVEHIDIYSKDGLLMFEREGGIWVLKKPYKYSYGKLPIIYFSQPEPEWADVQPLIERLETLWSNFGDVVDANASPVLYAKGIIKSLPARGDTAKVINVVPQIDRDGKEVGSSDLKYITWDAAPEAIKLESDNILNAIHFGSYTPDISSRGMADLGVKSGTGFDRVFVDAHLAANRQTKGEFGEGTQRALNFLKSACIAADTTLKPAGKMEITPDFPLFRINDEAETINMLTTATGGKAVISQKTGVELSGLVQDPEREFEQLQKEEDTLGQEVDSELSSGKSKLKVVGEEE